MRKPGSGQRQGRARPAAAQGRGPGKAGPRPQRPARDGTREAARRPGRGPDRDANREPGRESTRDRAPDTSARPGRGSAHPRPGHPERADQPRNEKPQRGAKARGHRNQLREDADQPPRQGRPRPSRRTLTVPAAPARARPDEPMRIAKAMARAGLCSRREAERWIEEGRVTVNGERLKSPARDVGPKDTILVDGRPLPDAEPVRLWRYYKPKGLVTTHRDPEGRPTVFEALPPELPRVVSIGRLDFNTEGLLLLTNDGELARHLELPATGWTRRYRVRAHGKVTQADLDALKDGVVVDGVRYGPIEATFDREQGANVWLTIGLKEGKNREVRNILGKLGLDVNRLIRVSYGPFQLQDLQPGAIDAVKRRVLADQLGPALAQQFGLRDEAQAEEARRDRHRRRGRERDPSQRNDPGDGLAE